jgi:hypothetical protein
VKTRNRGSKTVTSYGDAAAGRLRWARLPLAAAASLVMVAAPAAYLSAAPASASSDAPLTAPAINADSLSPIVSDGSAFVTVAADANGDVVMFYEPFGTSEWTRQVISNAAQTGAAFINPTIASNEEGQVEIVAWEQDTGYLLSWTGQVGDTFPAPDYVSTSGLDDQEPSLAYSPSGGNYVLADADVDGDINSWYTTDDQGDWSSSEQVVAGDSVLFQQAVITMTSQGAVVAGYGNVLYTFFDPYGEDDWTESCVLAQDVVPNLSLSITTSSSDAYVAFDSANDQGNDGVDVETLNDVGECSHLSKAGDLEAPGAGGYGGTAVAWSGSNIVVVSKDGDGVLRSWYSDSNMILHPEKVASDNQSTAYGTCPSVTIADLTVQIVDTTSTGADLYGFASTIGSSTQTRQKIGS